MQTRETDFMELVWENGQIMVQGPSKKGHISDNFQTLPPKTNDTRNSDRSKMSKFSMADSTISADFQLPVPSCDIELDDDVVDIVPWLNYPSIEDSMPNDYNTSDFLRELSGVTMNDLSTNNHLASKEKKISFQGNGYSSAIGNTSKASEKHISSLSNITSNRINSLDSIHNPSSLCAFTSLRLQKLDALQPRNNTTTSSGFTNFPCFSRHAALPRKWCNGNSETFPEKPAEEVLSSKDKLTEDVANNDANCAAAEKPEMPVVVAASSVCSGNSVERASNELKRDLKRKSRDTGDSEDPSEEVEEESANARKVSRSRGGLKRTRAAEVHNLSERRRRDRINEKMRSLQELIPNCNKVDKASMLDEAIEYLKTLQLQVQMLATGSGMYMPPMMLPPIHGGHMPHFSPMGVGMGLGFNMMDMNSCMKMIPFQGPHYAIPNMGPAFPGMPGSIFQGFGQGLPMPMQVQPPVLPATSVPSLNIPKENTVNPAASSDAMLR